MLQAMSYGIAGNVDYQAAGGVSSGTPEGVAVQLVSEILVVYEEEIPKTLLIFRESLLPEARADSHGPLLIFHVAFIPLSRDFEQGLTSAWQFVSNTSLRSYSNVLTQSACVPLLVPIVNCTTDSTGSNIQILSNNSYTYSTLCGDQNFPTSYILSSSSCADVVEATYTVYTTYALSNGGIGNQYTRGQVVCTLSAEETFFQTTAHHIDNLDIIIANETCTPPSGFESTNKLTLVELLPFVTSALQTLAIRTNNDGFGPLAPLIFEAILGNEGLSEKSFESMWKAGMNTAA